MGLLSREDLEQDHAEGVDVAGGSARPLARADLRGEVTGAAQQGPFAGQRVEVETADQPQISDLDSPLPVQEEVLGLDVAVDEALGMEGSQP